MHVQTNKHWKEVIPYLQDKITQEKVTPTLLKKIKSYPSYTLGLYILTAKKRRFKSLLVFLFFACISFLYGFYFTSGEKMGMSEQASCYSYHILTFLRN